MRTNISYIRTPGKVNQLFGIKGQIVNFVKNHFNKNPQYKISELYTKTVTIDIVKNEDFDLKNGNVYFGYNKNTYNRLRDFILANCDQNTNLIINIIEGFSKEFYFISTRGLQGSQRVDVNGLTVRNLTINQNSQNQDTPNNEYIVQPFLILNNIHVQNKTTFNIV